MSRNFEYLGETFQIQLINQLIVEKDFSHTILDVLEPTHFENKYFKTLVQLSKSIIQSMSVHHHLKLCFKL